MPRHYYNDVMPATLFELLRDRSLPALLRAIRADPKKALHIDDHGFTLVHRAVWLHAPEAVEALLKEPAIDAQAKSFLVNTPAVNKTNAVHALLLNELFEPLWPVLVPYVDWALGDYIMPLLQIHGWDLSHCKRQVSAVATACPEQMRMGFVRGTCPLDRMLTQRYILQNPKVTDDDVLYVMELDPLQLCVVNGDNRTVVSVVVELAPLLIIEAAIGNSCVRHATTDTSDLMAIACFHREEKVIRALLKAGYPADGKKMLHSYPVSFAIQRNMSAQLVGELVRATPDLNNQDIFGDTIAHVLARVKRPEKFYQCFAGREVDVMIKNKAGRTCLDDLVDHLKRTDPKHVTPRMNEFIAILTSGKRKRINRASDFLIKVEETTFTTYRNTFTDAMMYLRYLVDKLPGVGLPVPPKRRPKIRPEDYSNAVIAEAIDHPRLFYSTIVFDEVTKQVIAAPDMAAAIRRSLKAHKYVVVFLYEQFETNAHANIHVIDRERRLIFHFEPYGIVLGANESGAVYTELERWYKERFPNFTYVSPLDYLKVSGLQHLSLEDVDETRIINDPSGYCLAWSMLAVELYVRNVKKLDRPPKQPADLIRTFYEAMVGSMIRYDKSVAQYIRNYANHLFLKSIQYMQKTHVFHDFKKARPQSLGEVFDVIERALEVADR